METSWVQGSLQLERMSSLTDGVAAPFPGAALPFPCPPQPHTKPRGSGKWPGRPGVPPSQGLVPGSSACWPAFSRQSLRWSRASSRAHALALWEELRPLWLVRVSEATCVWKPLGWALLVLQKDLFFYFYFFFLANSLTRPGGTPGATSGPDSMLRAEQTLMAFVQG